MIPSVVGRQIRETILDYLETTFALTDERFEEQLFSFLDRDDGLFRGPYVSIRLPFRKAAPGESIPLEIAPDFDPYKHQLKSFQRLSSAESHHPENSLVTTGTGSGKTECFLYPILDHCWRNRGSRGIKAIILYPMNALASDQARRLADLLWNDGRLKGEVSAGLYVGGDGEHGAADESHLVDKREVLRDSPPDILLTNYKMLDFLLMRPEDRKLWRHNDPDTLRYLVLDELHTYDGAQGSDVACLIRRLKRRLGSDTGSIVSVGTSATIGGTMKGETIEALTRFASKVFDTEFDEESVITEDRYTAEETLGSIVDIDTMPGVGDAAQLAPERYPDAEAWLAAQTDLWLGESELSPVEIGERLERHEFLRDLLRVLRAEPTSIETLAKELEPRVPGWEKFDAEMRRRILESFIALVSHARRRFETEEGAPREEPFLTVQVQVWVRELRNLVMKVQDPGRGIELAWEDDGPQRSLENHHWLQVAHCRECGANGLATWQQEGERELQTEGAGLQWFLKSRSARYIAFGHGALAGEMPPYLCTRCLSILPTAGCGDCLGVDGEALPTVPIRISDDTSENNQFLARCPDCGTNDALSILGSRAPSLLSVAISHLYQTDYNHDKKLLAFTDSVQDASHRAGFFGARTYRFNLRTAMQSVIEAAEDGGVPLSELGDRLFDYWAERKPREELIPTLLPADLRELDEYRRFVEAGGSGKHVKLETSLRRRLSWEAAMEFGLNARVGRTLENTLSATVEEDIAAIEEVAEKLRLDLAENSPLGSEPEREITKEGLFHFVSGLLHRLRLRGGVYDPLLSSYIASGGNWFHLTKGRQPLMSPFRGESVLPRFLTDRARAGGGKQVFDTFLSRSKPPLTWQQDWAARVLGFDPFDTGINDLYRTMIRRLESDGLLLREEVERGGGSAWGLNPERLNVTANVAELVCVECNRHVSVSRREAERWESKPCTYYRCTGVFALLEQAEQSYYARIYRSGRLQRIYSHEHTGLLGRSERERLEEEFKSGKKPGATNLFVATPTLEMGIDVGDLSAAVLCSVPPTTSNYLQRVGRAGRKTGNALCLTVANSRPHDLYFHAQPMEMMAGQVLPPGCFLDAPDMLRRQMAAHAMDAWARQEEEVTRIPRRVGDVLSDRGRADFPGRFIDFYRRNREDLTARFLELFESYLSEHNRDALEDFGLGDGIPNRVTEAITRVDDELRNLRSLQTRARKRKREIEREPDSVKDAETELREIEDHRHSLNRLIQELREKYPLNVLTDEGVLPNYAFPEPGVQLESVVSHESGDGQRKYHANEYVRPASSAIRELAPFNTFYAEGRKVTINEIDVGNRTRPLLEDWRFCQECNYMERELTEEGETATLCPRCEDVNWPDQGQRRSLVHFRRSRSIAGALESSTVDDTEDRESERYRTLDLIDVSQENYAGAKLIEELPFGYELLRDVPLREVNFGLEARGSQTMARVRGTAVPEQGFIVCSDCGRVLERGKDKINHTATCRTKRPKTEEERKSVSLYREVRSEAIRILLPVSEVDVEETRASFQAALQLGFRRHFEGDPGHLIVRSSQEPGGVSGRRQFLVVFDGVPGGTGFLADLWGGDSFIEMLRKALEALTGCTCQRDPLRDGCYRCLFAYQSQRDLKLISSRKAQKLLAEILNKADQLQDVPTLSDVTLETKVESELEEKFIAALKTGAKKTDGWSLEEKLSRGEVTWLLTIDRERWEIVPQKKLGRAEGVSLMSRPDFIIAPLSRDPGIRPVALFCDGLAFHALPGDERGRIWDDIEKREAIIESERYVVWAVTWKDVTDFEDGVAEPSYPTLADELSSRSYGQLLEKFEVSLPRKAAGLGSMEMLVEYLRKPDLTMWRGLAAAYSLGWWGRDQNWMVGDSAEELERQLKTEVTRFEPGPSEMSAEGEVLSRARSFGFASVFARNRRSSVTEGRVDRILLRLFDEKEARSDTKFESSWRAFLREWNLLQFVDELEVVSSELIERGPGEPGVVAADDLAAETSTGETAEDLPELAILLDLSTEMSKPLIEAAARANLPLPELGFELETGSAGVGPEAELAWPERRFAVLSERQAEDRDAFEREGWVVHEQPVAPEELVELLIRRGEELKPEGVAR